MYIVKKYVIKIPELERDRLSLIIFNAYVI